MQGTEADQKKRKRPKAPVSSSKLAVKKGKSSKGLGLVNKWQAVRKDLVSHSGHRELLLSGVLHYAVLGCVLLGQRL